MTERQIIIYCDESDDKGKFFSHFYGGALIKGKDREIIESKLATKKFELNFTREVKWTKITESYLTKYIDFIDCFFEFITSGQIKIRIMFTQNMYEPILLSEYQIEHEYFLLYYQLITNAFGLEHCNTNNETVNIQLILDDMPNKSEKVVVFKNYLTNLSKLPSFKNAHVRIVAGNISEVRSHNHPILQGLDIILGAMQFRLNNLHKEKPDGQRVRGKRTRAKEAVYKHINKKIREIMPGFNIGTTTPAVRWPTDIWDQPYRHWRFKPSNHKINTGRSKKAP
jgi:hypothetical protein